MHLISIRLSSLIIFFSSFLHSALFFFLLFLFIRHLGWQERSEWKSRQERKSKIVLPSQRLWKLLPLNADDSLRWNCGLGDFTGLWCMIFGYLFIYLFIWDYKANSFYILFTLSIFLKHFSGKYHFFCFAFSLSFLLMVCVWLIWI